METWSTFAAEIGAGTAPEWVHLLPAGMFQGRDGRGPFTANLDAVRRRTLDYWQGTDIVIDYDHQTVRAAKNGAAAPAAGWIKELEVRDDGLWGRAEWTLQAKAMIERKEYRYLSPVFTHSAGQPATVNFVWNVGLVNGPNLNLVALNSAALPTIGASDMTLKSLIAAALGEAADTPDDELVAAMQARLNAPPDPRKYVPVAQVQEMMRDMGSKISTHTVAEIERQVNDAVTAGRLPPALKGWGLQLCSADPAAFETFVANAPVIVAPGISYAHMAAPPAPSGRADGGSPEERVLARELGISVEDLRKSQ